MGRAIWGGLINNKLLTFKDANYFREPTKYFKRLTNKLKADEIKNSIPVKSFTNWIIECFPENDVFKVI